MIFAKFNSIGSTTSFILPWRVFPGYPQSGGNVVRQSERLGSACDDTRSATSSSNPDANGSDGRPPDFRHHLARLRMLRTRSRRFVGPVGLVPAQLLRRLPSYPLGQICAMGVPELQRIRSGGGREQRRAAYNEASKQGRVDECNGRFARSTSPRFLAQRQLLYRFRAPTEWRCTMDTGPAFWLIMTIGAAVLVGVAVTYGLISRRGRRKEKPIANDDEISGR